MAFAATLNMAGKEWTILNLHYSLTQETDAMGQPSSIARGGKLTLTVEATDDTTFFDWMTNSWERKDGSIKYKKRDSDATLKELKFKDSYLVNYTENFDHDSNQPLSETVTLSAKELDLGNAKFTNNWTKS
jgi:hypothetical protein